MKRRVIPLTRRQFLTGASGFTLALPVLSSLFVKKAYAADPVFLRRPRLYWLATNHGGALESNFFPTPSPFTESLELLSDHRVSASPLKRQDSTPGTTVLSPILRAPNDVLTEGRVSRLNVLRGLDIPFIIGHHCGGHLGNYAFNEGLAGIAREVQSEPRPTIDQLLGWSRSFYDDSRSTRERVLVAGTRPLSFGYSNPSAATGSVQNIRGTVSSLELFRRLFAPGDTAEGARVPVVDRVFESYRRLRDGNRRLSAADRQRLNDHMDRLAELQRKLNTVPPMACSAVVTPSNDSALHMSPDPGDAVHYAQLLNEVIAAAFICGATRIAVLGIADEQRFVDFTGDWHFEIAHYWIEPEKQALLAQAYQRIFEKVLLDMVARLDTEEADGVTYLDNSLLVWSQESGMSTHDPLTIPIVTAGAAAGFLRTGLSVDYRRADNPDSRFQPLLKADPMYAGLLYNQFLATVLRSMGMPPSEFERWGHRGYGLTRLEQSNPAIPYAKHYQNTSSAYFRMASDVLPLLKA